MPIKVTQLSEYTSTIGSNSNVVFLIVDTQNNITKKVKANNIQFATVGSGYTGSIGSIGYSGSQGIPGVSVQGFTGSSGSAGTTGYTGSGGLGYTGSIGYTGSLGSTGYTGSLGSSGSFGYTGSSGSAELTFNTKTTGYTLVLSDASKVVDMNLSSSNNMTVPSNANVAFPIGTQIIVLQSGTANVNISNQIGVTVYSRLGLKLAGQWAGATVIKTGTDSWVAIGDLTT